jgi:hypothetical protein
MTRRRVRQWGVFQQRDVIPYSEELSEKWMVFYGNTGEASAVVVNEELVINNEDKKVYSL